MVGSFTERRDVNAFLKSTWFLETKAITEGIISKDVTMDLIVGGDDQIDISFDTLFVMVW